MMPGSTTTTTTTIGAMTDITADTTTMTVRRCMTCNVVLHAPVGLPSSRNVMLMCSTCLGILRNWEECIEYRENRYCICGHPLSDHEYIRYDMDAPSPCEAEPVDVDEEKPCACRNFQEAEN